MNLADLRTDYRQAELRRATLLANPVEQFQRWLEAACAPGSGVVEPTAMGLGTVSADGRPRVRTVLLKGCDERGFVFYTNFSSRKGQQLGNNPNVSLLFAWLALERQVLVSGQAAPVSREEAQAYFVSRPRASQLAAWASHQSTALASREALEDGLAAIEQRFGTEGEVPLPPFWGGYRVVPERIEFWQGRSNRLHDRFEYTRQLGSGVWHIERLAP